MNLRDRNLRMTLLKAFAEAIDAELTRERATHRDELVARYADEGTKSFDVKLPDGTKVAAISLTVPKPSATVTDREAFGKWAVANQPDLFKTVIHPAVPAQPERPETVVDEKRLTELIARVKPVDSSTESPVVDPDTGAIVDGVTYRPAETPKSFSVRYTDDGRENLGRAYRAGVLDDLVLDTPLRAIRQAQS